MASKRALVLEDSKAMRSLLARLLGEFDFEVFQAANGKEGLEKLGRLGPVDLVLVDWNMPEMDGLGFVSAVRAEARYDDVRLMMVTTETERERVAAALDAGANEYAMKPFTKEVLAEKLTLLGFSNTSA